LVKVSAVDISGFAISAVDCGSIANNLDKCGLIGGASVNAGLGL
jgi:hypothetical protein